MDQVQKRGPSTPGPSFALTRTRTSRYGKYNLVCPSYNREAEGARTFQANGAKLWNSIPLDIRKKDSIGSFKPYVRKYLLGKNSKSSF